MKIAWKLSEISKKNTKNIGKVTAKARDSTAEVPTSLKSWESGRVVWLIFIFHSIIIQFSSNLQPPLDRRWPFVTRTHSAESPRNYERYL